MNDTVKIRNKVTGEVREVPRSELPKYIQPSPTPTPTSTGGSGFQIPKDILPLGGGIIGGLGGTALAGPPGGVVGAAGGAGIGANIQNLIDTLSKRQMSTNPVGEAALAGGSQLAGVGLAKGLGMIFSPTRFLGEIADTLLKRSPKTVDLGGVLSNFEKTAGNEFTRRTQADVGRQVIPQLSSNTRAAAGQLLQDVMPPGQVPNLESVTELAKFPPLLLNQLKRNVTKSIEDFYGEASGKPEIEARKILGHLLRQSTEGVSPTIKVPNKIASALYAVPDALKQMTYAFPWSTGRAIRGFAGLPVKAVQAAFPYGGGKLNYLLPTLLQMNRNKQVNKAD